MLLIHVSFDLKLSKYILWYKGTGGEWYNIKSWLLTFIEK